MSSGTGDEVGENHLRIDKEADDHRIGSLTQINKEAGNLAANTNHDLGTRQTARQEVMKRLPLAARRPGYLPAAGAS